MAAAITVVAIVHSTNVAASTCAALCGRTSLDWAMGRLPPMHSAPTANVGGPEGLKRWFIVIDN